MGVSSAGESIVAKGVQTHRGKSSLVGIPLMAKDLAELLVTATTRPTFGVSVGLKLTEVACPNFVGSKVVSFHANARGRIGVLFSGRLL